MMSTMQIISTGMMKTSVNHCRVTGLRSRRLICWISRTLSSDTVIRSLDAAGFYAQSLSLLLVATQLIAHGRFLVTGRSFDHSLYPHYFSQMLTTERTNNIKVSMHSSVSELYGAVFV